jgi:hypothetical protein
LNTRKYGLSVSAWAVLAAMVFIAIIRLNAVNKNETSWDVLGYYLPLPATVIYDDPMMNDRAWIEKINTEKQLTGTLYQVTTNDEGEPMYFFLFGMSLFYLPFFYLGHIWAYFSGAPMDGFSEPYQYSLVFGGLIYTFIGLLLLHKILRHYFTPRITAITILIVVFATNYSHHLSYKNLETVNVLFLLMCWLIWSTIRWHEDYKFRQLAQIGIAITLMALVKPSEVLALFIPLFWSVNSFRSLKEKLRMLAGRWKQLFAVILICLLIASPQIAYWYLKTGHFFYDSYKNAGVGLDIFSPHILDVLFSYKKGWLIYTPVMILGLIGLVRLFRKNKTMGWSFGIYFLVSFYIICSWTEWWYGAAYSCRPVITAYPILAIAIATLLTGLKVNWQKAAVGGFVVLCVSLDLFQWWQLMAGIYDPYRTTKEYYWAIFLKTQPPANAEELKSVLRSFEPGQQWADRDRYRIAEQVELVKGEPYWTKEEFDKLSYKAAFEELTQKDHAWIDIEVRYETSDSVFTDGPFLVTTMLYKGEAYGYQGPALPTITDTIGGELVLHYQYLTPEARTVKDEFSTYIWNPAKNNLKVKSFKIKAYERKK